MSKPRVVFLSSSRDMAHWAALTATHVRDFADRHGIGDLHVQDYRDIDPAEINHADTWQDAVGAPSRLEAALTLVLFGERLGTPLTTTFRLKEDIHKRLQQNGYDWVHVAGTSEGSVQDGRVPLTGTLFEYFDAFLPKTDGSTSVPLRVFFKGSFAGTDPPDFGNGEFLAQINALGTTPRGRLRQQRELKEYVEQLEWLGLFWNKLYGRQQHAQIFCKDETALLSELDHVLTATFLAYGSRASPGSRSRIDPALIDLPGLAPYDLEQAPLFLGRGLQLSELARRCLHSHAGRLLVPVIGDNGAGKSSLLRAGLLNDARSGARRREGWRTAYLSMANRPAATDPLLLLAEALAEPSALPELGDKAALRQRLGGISPLQATARLLEILAELEIEAALGCGPPRLLLVVDQFELALDGVGPEGADAAGWRSALQVIAALGDGVLDAETRDRLDQSVSRFAAKVPCTVVIGLPTNRLDRLEAELRPGELIFTLPRLVDETGLREVITGTFAKLGLSVEPRALETLCHHAVTLAADTKGSILPLVSVSLKALHLNWKRGQSNREARGRDWLGHAASERHSASLASGLAVPLDHAAHFDVTADDVASHGRLELAIEDLGERAWIAAYADPTSVSGALGVLPITASKLRAQSGEIDARDVALAQLLRRLVVVAPDPSAPDRLVGMSDKDLPDLARPLADALREHRLLTQREDSTWWLMHFAVLGNWERAKQWRTSEMGAYKTVADLRRDYSRWQIDAADEPDAHHWLWTRSRQVGEAIDWLAVRGLEENAELVTFAKAGMLVAAGQDPTLAARILRAASFFNDTIWCSEVIGAAGGSAKEACATWSADGTASALTNASNHSNVELVQLLLAHGARPTPSPVGHGTALHAAANAGASLPVVDLLLEAGAVIDHAEDSGWTALLLAARGGHEPVVARLLDAGAAIEHVENAGRTPLLIAAERGHETVVARLLDAGADPNHATARDETALMLATGHGHGEIVRRLIERNANIDAQELSGSTALYRAVESNNEDIVKLLLDGGADIRKSTNLGWTVLHEAAITGNLELIRLLASRGAPLDAQDKRGWTALRAACASDQNAAIETLLACKADQRIEDHDGLTALLVTALHANTAGIEAFLTADASLSTANSDGLNVLCAAAAVGDPEFIDFLTRMGADPDPAPPLIKPLIRAAQDGNADAIRVLHARGAAVDALDDRGLSGLMYASWFGHASAVGALLELGADPNLTGAGGWTPLMFAVICNWTIWPSDPAAAIGQLLRAGSTIEARDELNRNVSELVKAHGSPLVHGVFKSFTVELSDGLAGDERRATTGAPTEPHTAARQSAGMNVELAINARFELIVFHNKPFPGALISLTYEQDERRLSFNFGDERHETTDFGIPVRPELDRYLSHSPLALMVLVNEETGEPVEGNYFPIIQIRHGAPVKVLATGTLAGSECIVRITGLTLHVEMKNARTEYDVAFAEYDVIAKELLLYSSGGHCRQRIEVDQIWQPSVIKCVRISAEPYAEEEDAGASPARVARYCTLRYAFAGTIIGRSLTGMALSSPPDQDRLS